MSVPAQTVRKKADNPAIDLTPMLDVVFILLIFFVVNAVLFDESSMPLNSQEENSKQQLDGESALNILVEIKADNRILFNGKAIEPGAARAHIMQVLAQNREAAVIIKPESASVANTLVKIVDAARSAGVDNILLSE